MSEYQSYVLRTCDSEDVDCAVCRFLSGDMSTDTLLEVIRVLDATVARKTKALDAYVSAYCDHAAKRGDK